MLATVNQLRDIRGRRSLEILMNPRNVRDEKSPPAHLPRPVRTELSVGLVYPRVGFSRVGLGRVL